MGEQVIISIDSDLIPLLIRVLQKEERLPVETRTNGEGFTVSAARLEGIGAVAYIELGILH